MIEVVNQDQLIELQDKDPDLAPFSRVLIDCMGPYPKQGVETNTS